MNDVIKFDTVTQAFGVVPGQSKCSGHGLGELTKGMKKGLEIGCSEAHTSKFLLDTNPELTLYSIVVIPFLDNVKTFFLLLSYIKKFHQEHSLLFPYKSYLVLSKVIS